jgi:hypothetical protein
VPSTIIFTELLPSVISNRFAWNVGVLEPDGSSVPAISLRPPSPIRHTYTRADARSDRVTIAIGAVAIVEGPAPCLRVCAACPCVAFEVDEPDARFALGVAGPPPVSLRSPTTSSAISSSTAPTSAI